jgi:hypothetical protein
MKALSVIPGRPQSLAVTQMPEPASVVAKACVTTTSPAAP